MISLEIQLPFFICSRAVCALVIATCAVQLLLGETLRRETPHTFIARRVVRRKRLLLHLQIGDFLSNDLLEL